jgi:hypothetical protein
MGTLPLENLNPSKGLTHGISPQDEAQTKNKLNRKSGSYLLITCQIGNRDKVKQESQKITKKGDNR